jgi:NAD(P)-dependent dehydrogenase (short-subunit alcohol dehydrogenase family)
MVAADEYEDGIVTNFDELGYRGATVVVVGCASGIGAATAQLLGDLGAKVHAVSLHTPTVPHDAYYPTDLADVKQIDATAHALADIGPIDHLFCASGVPATRDPMHVIRVNYLGVRYFVDQVIPTMRAGGSIAIVASSAGRDWETRLPTLLEVVALSDPADVVRWFEAHPEVVPEGYRIAKQLQMAWVASQAPALAETRGLRLNCTAPGPTATPLVDETTQRVPAGYFDRYPYPVLGRISTPEEQAWPLVLLSSRRNAVVSGAVLYTDQGVNSGMITGTVDPPH